MHKILKSDQLKVRSEDLKFVDKKYAEISNNSKQISSSIDLLLNDQMNRSTESGVLKLTFGSVDLYPHEQLKRRLKGVVGFDS